MELQSSKSQVTMSLKQILLCEVGNKQHNNVIIIYYKKEKS